MDAKLNYREHTARAASKGLEAVIELRVRQLKGLSPATARQPFTATVMPVVDYASNVWMHGCRYRSAIPINGVQKIEAQAHISDFNIRTTSDNFTFKLHSKIVIYFISHLYFER